MVPNHIYYTDVSQAISVSTDSDRPAVFKPLHSYSMLHTNIRSRSNPNMVQYRLTPTNCSQNEFKWPLFYIEMCSPLPVTPSVQWSWKKPSSSPDQQVQQRLQSLIIFYPISSFPPLLRFSWRVGETSPAKGWLMAMCMCVGLRRSFGLCQKIKFGSWTSRGIMRKHAGCGSSLKTPRVRRRGIRVRSLKYK